VKAQTLAEHPSIVEFEDGRRNIIVRTKIGVMAVTGGHVDFTLTDASGRGIREQDRSPDRREGLVIAPPVRNSI
jgi:hypothetical protein